MNDNNAFAMIMLLVALVGLATNGFVILLSSKASAFKNTFGLLVKNEAFGALLFSLVFAFYAAPAVIFDLESWQPRQVSARFGHVAILSHDICLFSHTCISINRFIAAYLPTRYTSIYTKNKTKTMMVFINLLALLLTAVHYIEPCWLYFDFSKINFTYDFTEDCGRILALDIQFPRNVALICICSSIDVLTYIKLRIINRKDVKTTGLGQSEQRRRHKVELALISQVCVQAVVYIVEFLTYFEFSPHFENSWIVFLLTTFAWQMVHALDGVVVFVFNREMRNLVGRHFGFNGGVQSISVTRNGASMHRY